MIGLSDYPIPCLFIYGASRFPVVATGHHDDDDDDDVEDVI